MDIAGAVAAERLREITVELVERSAAVARRYGGTALLYGLYGWRDQAPTCPGQAGV